MPVGWERGQSWTIEALKNHIDSLFDAHEKLDDSRFASLREAAAVLSLQAREYRAAANEWRAALNDSRNEFLSKAEYKRANQAVIDQIGFSQKQIADLKGRMTVILVAFPIIAAVAIAFLHILQTP